MNAKALHFRSITELAPLLAAREITSEELTEACLAEIAGKSEPLRAFITVTGDEALEQARALDRELAAGDRRGPLHGVPISLKDLIDVAGVPTTAASRVRHLLAVPGRPRISPASGRPRRDHLPRRRG